ncbi:MAG: DUF975 family protein [Candidatus Izemoplasmatales bacterium]|jgi:uncharacterized membrane protein
MRHASSFYREEARNKMVGRYGDVIIFFILTGLLSFGFGYLMRYFSPTIDQAGNIIDPGIPMLVTVINIINFIYSAGIFYSQTSMFIDVTNDDSFTVIEKIKEGFVNDYGRNIILMFLQTIFIMLWTFLFIIPGIVKSYAYSMSMYLAVKESDLSGSDAITKSKNLMDGNKADLFFLDLSYIGWYFLSLFTFGILLLWVVPKHMTARTIFFNEIYDANLSGKTTKKVEFEEPLF